MAARFSRRVGRAFTLVELLVVIGIISVLISILMPALSMAHEAANATKCVSNLRQLSIVLVAYINDNSGWLPVQTGDIGDFATPSVYNAPGDTNWAASLSVYFTTINSASQVWLCPSAQQNVAGENPAPPNDTNYMGNAAVLGHRLSRITNTSQIIWVQENAFCWDTAWLRPSPAGGTPPEYSYWGYSNSSLENYDTYSNLHYQVGVFGSRKGGGNVGFLDGHADYFKTGSLRPSDFGLSGVPGISTSSDTVDYGGNPYYGIADN